MDFQKTKRPLEDSRVYILIEEHLYEHTILAVFATRVAADMAMKYYAERIDKPRHTHYYISEKEVLDQTSISKGEGPQTTTVGEGSNTDPVPETGA